MRYLRFIDNIFKRLEQGILISSLAIIVGVNLLQIGIRLLQNFLRFLESDAILNVPSWPADMNRILVLWLAIVGGSLATRTNEHIKVDLLTRFLTGKLRAIVNAAIYSVGIIISGIVVCISIPFLVMEYELEETLVAIPLPLWVIQLIIPVGFAIIGFRFFLHLLECFGLKAYEKDDAASLTQVGSSEPEKG